MKKIILFLLILAAHSIKAQSFNAGLYTGLAACQVDGDQISGYNKPGAILGAFVNRNISENWVWQLEMEFIQKGSRQIPKPQNGNVHYLIKLNYIQVPVMFRYFNKGFGYEGGLSFGTLVKSEVQKDFSVIGITPLNPAFFRSELALNLGIGTTLGDRFYINWRFSYSVLPIRDYTVGSSLLRRTGQFNNLMEFTLGYLISKAGKK